MNDGATVREFLAESNEQLDSLDAALMALERDPADRELVASIFRSLHTLKGSAGFLGFEKIESLMHAGENLLSDLRDGERPLEAAMVSALLAMVDAIREILRSVAEDGLEGDGDYGVLARRLADVAAVPAAALAMPRLAEILIEEGKVRPRQVAQALAEQAAGDPRRIGEILVEQGAVRPEDVRFALLEQGPAGATPRLGEILIDEGLVEKKELLAAIEQQVSERDPRRIGEILVERGAVAPGDVLDALQRQSQVRRSGARVESSIRIEVSLLDTLMQLVGELALARDEILDHGAAPHGGAFAAATQRLDRVTSALQAGMTRTRMQRIGDVWSKLPRVVRDLSSACRKQVRIAMEGQEVEVDKTILEPIKDALTHIVRNSIDHGFEPPEERVAAGKPIEGELRLRAFRAHGQMHIEVADDGRGIDPARIRATALEKNLITLERAARMSDRELVELVFVAGFSTAESATHVSGRGVGMDVVKTNVERIGGTIDIASRLGAGTVLRIQIPLVRAIAPALFVTRSGER